MKISDALKICRGEIAEHRRLAAYHEARRNELEPRSAPMLRAFARSATTDHNRKAEALSLLLARGASPRAARRSRPIA